MLQLDGFDINIGDKVYDIANGYGNVSEVTDNKFTVLFLNRRRLTFKGNGNLSGVKRVFWHDPLILAPPKDAAEWRHLIHIVIGVQGLLSQTPNP